MVRIGLLYNSDSLNQQINLFLLCTEERIPYDETGQRAYYRACHRFQALPSMSFHRKLGYATQIDMRHYGTGPRGAQAIAIPMVVSSLVHCFIGG